MAFQQAIGKRGEVKNKGTCTMHVMWDLGGRNQQKQRAYSQQHRASNKHTVNSFSLQTGQRHPRMQRPLRDGKSCSATVCVQASASVSAGGGTVQYAVCAGPQGTRYHGPAGRHVKFTANIAQTSPSNGA